MTIRCLIAAAALSCLLCATSFSQEAKPASPGGAEDQRPAEQVYKNIQVMKGVPASRLPMAMAFFARSLGVDCVHCHVPNEFEKDDKAAKGTARRMLTMVHHINDDNFAPDHPISCWTCHRGNVKPESFPK